MLRNIGPWEVLVLALAALVVVPFWRIFSKAGFPGIMSLALVVPVLNIVMIVYLAFAEWPALRELKDFRRREGR